MAKAKTWEVTEEFWKRIEPLIPIRQRLPDQAYACKEGGRGARYRSSCGANRHDVSQLEAVLNAIMVERATASTKQASVR